MVARSAWARSPQRRVRRVRSPAGPRRRAPCAVAREDLVQVGLVHQPAHRHPVAGEADQRAPGRQAGDEGAGAVDGIEHPDAFRILPLGAELLAEDAVAGEGLADQRPQDDLRRPVGLRHRIERRAAPRLVLQGELRPEERQDRLARGVGEVFHEPAEFDDAHAGSAPTGRRPAGGQTKAGAGPRRQAPCPTTSGPEPPARAPPAGVAGRPSRPPRRRRAPPPPPRAGSRR